MDGAISQIESYPYLVYRRIWESGPRDLNLEIGLS